MRYLMLYKPADDKSERGLPPTEQEIARMEKFLAEIAKTGALLSAEGCQPSSAGVRVRRTNSKVKVTDGPFAESKEVIGGLAIVQYDSLAEAIEMAKRFLEVAGDGESEIRPLYDGPPADQKEA
ncbi:MAG TPA: YciI family protein [Gemmatimonadaceae bacterium]|jgi:hypothetical protein|nr:YciI family protein [Gemmatimonadaceae bacterium]